MHTPAIFLILDVSSCPMFNEQAPPNRADPSTIFTVSKLTVITLPIRLTMYSEIVRTVWVVDDAAAFVRFDAILVDYPL